MPEKTLVKDGLIEEYEKLHHFLLEHSYYGMTLKQRNRHDELKRILQL